MGSPHPPGCEQGHERPPADEQLLRQLRNHQRTRAGHPAGGPITMKLAATEFVTLDGVYQGPGGPDEDRRGGFDRGGWTAAYGDEEGWQFLVSWFERADAFLLGRKTWEI